MNVRRFMGETGPDAPPRRALALCSLALVAATLLVYWPVAHHEFVTYDDYEYVVANPHVQAGLSWPGVKWAFTTFYAGNWHPLTWLSHMLDVTWFGKQAGGPHRVNVGLHGLNTVLLFLLLWRMTGALARSAFVAALFALHPLHVESVAWVAERKDVLSTVFLLLTLWAYVRYAAARPGPAVQSLNRRPDATVARCSGAAIHYFLALLWFALGLMSKPMLVTLPCVLLLLDVWPLRRVTRDQGHGTGGPRGFGSTVRAYLPLLREKIPFFALSAVSCLITMRAQRTGGAVVPVDQVPVASRLGNALIAYFRYLRKTVWPDDLAVFYPYPVPPPLGQVIGAGVFLGAVFLVVAILVRRRPYLLVGWLWYLGTLVPVIGLVQVGGQSMADRYSYVPLIGVFIMVTWLAGDVAARRPRWAWANWALAATALAGCLVTTSRQIPHWRNTERLFTRALRVTTGNYIMHALWGGVLHKQGRLDAAIAQYRESLRLHPANAEVNDSLGCALLEQGKLDEATVHLRRAIQINPQLASAYNDLGQALAQQGRNAEAVTQYETALQLDPALPDAHNNLGNALFAQKKYADAELHYRAALRLRPGFVPAHHNLGLVLAARGRTNEAVAEFSAGLKIQPDHVPTQHALAELFLRQGRNAEAIRCFETIVRQQPRNAEARFRLGVLRAAEGQTAEGLRQLREAVRLRPDAVPALNELAWRLATHPDAQFRDATQAVKLAGRAVALTRTNDAAVLDTLAAALAEAGRFDEAGQTARQAARLAESARQPELASQIQKRAVLYQSRRPYRE
jgi:tetratricopeptide (TPR) repeat protein